MKKTFLCVCVGGGIIREMKARGCLNLFTRGVAKKRGKSAEKVQTWLDAVILCKLSSTTNSQHPVKETSDPPPFSSSSRLAATAMEGGRALVFSLLLDAMPLIFRESPFLSPSSSHGELTAEEETSAIPSPCSSSFLRQFWRSQWVEMQLILEEEKGERGDQPKSAWCLLLLRRRHRQTERKHLSSPFSSSPPSLSLR